MTVAAPNVPNPDPSVVANERLEEAKAEIRREVLAKHNESKGWVESLQVLTERELRNAVQFLIEKIEGGLRNIGTRLDGNDTALVAALKAQKEEAAKQTENFKEVLGEIKVGIAKQFDSLNSQIGDLKQRMSESGGRSMGASSTVTVIISALAALAAIVSVVIVLSRPSPVEVRSDPVQQHHIKTIAGW